MVKRRSSQIVVHDDSKRHANEENRLEGPLSDAMAKYSPQNKFHLVKRQIIEIPIVNGKLESLYTQQQKQQYKAELWDKCKDYIDSILGSWVAPKFALESACTSATELYRFDTGPDMLEYVESSMKEQLGLLFKNILQDKGQVIVSNSQEWLRRASQLSDVLITFDRNFLAGQGKLDIHERAVKMLKSQVIDLKREASSPTTILQEYFFSLLKQVRQLAPGEIDDACYDQIDRVADVVRKCALEKEWLERNYASDTEGRPPPRPWTTLEELNSNIETDVKAEDTIGSSILDLDIDVVRGSMASVIRKRVEQADIFDRLGEVAKMHWDLRNSVDHVPQLWEFITIKWSTMEARDYEEYIVKSIVDQGIAIIRDPGNQKTFIYPLLELLMAYNYAICPRDEGFSIFWDIEKCRTKQMACLRAAFRQLFLREDCASKIAERLAKVCDDMMTGRRNSLVQLAASTDEAMEMVVQMLRSVDGRDVFEKMYQRDYGRRLLQNKSTSLELEESMFAVMKDVCHPEFLKHLEKMTEEIKTSRTLSAKFREVSEGSPLNVNVLDKTHWPSYPESNLVVPAVIRTMQDGFEQYYEVGNAKRKLHWSNDLAQCILTARFDKRTHELQISGTQACILLALENSDSEETAKSFDEIQAICGPQVNKTFLLRGIESLCIGKYRILCKSGTDKRCSPNEKFWVNTHFSDPNVRIKVPAQLASAAEQTKAAKNEIIVDRRHRIRAAIVRAAKQHKELTKQSIIALVMADTKAQGTLTAADIDKEIEFCVERTYLAKHGDNYKYI